MAKGDSVTIACDLGNGTPAPLQIKATQNGRKLEIEQDSKRIEVREVTRGGTTVRRVWVPIAAVLYLDIEIRGEE